MPILECLIKRDGPTPINDGGMRFLFENNERGHCICDVLSEAVADRLLHHQWFRLYRPTIDYPESPQKTEVPVVVMAKSIAPETTTRFQPPVEAADKAHVDQRILLLAGDGHKQADIARVVNRSPSYVSKILKQEKG